LYLNWELSSIFLLSSSSLSAAGGVSAADSYWDARYQLRETHVWAPTARWAERTLITGKDLNVVRSARADALQRARQRARANRSRASSAAAAAAAHGGSSAATSADDLNSSSSSSSSSSEVFGQLKATDANAALADDVLFPDAQPIVFSVNEQEYVQFSTCPFMTCMSS
jgi:hypothetical protein